MKKTLLLFLVGLTFAHGKPPPTICYFSLNSAKEYQTMQNFTAKVEQKTGTKVEVKEFQSKGSNPEQSFKQMVDSGTKCHGLVISGHHTGSFGGKRAAGSLGINFLEDISCDPKYKDWFKDIQALWLQGCRTLGEKITIDEEVSADFHTLRVGEVLEEDHLEQSFADLNMEFSATLDQDNPLSSRYLRVFPSATVFGWTKTSPGEKASSERSLPYHIAHIARLTNDREEYFQDPLGGKLDMPSAVAFASTMLGMLNNESLVPNDPCSITEEDKIRGWLFHGGVQGANPYYLANSDLQGFPSLATINRHSELLYRSKEINCLLKRDLEKEELLGIIDEVLPEDLLLGYNFNSLWELINRLKIEGPLNIREEVLSRMQNSVALSTFITRKLESKELGGLRKIDYYAFYRDLTGKKIVAIEEKIRQAAQEVLLRDPNSYGLRDYQETLWQSLGKHGLINERFLLQIVDHPKATGICSCCGRSGSEGKTQASFHTQK